jgi:hypothetical protein
MDAMTANEIRTHILARWQARGPAGLSLAAEFSDAFTAATSVTEGLWAIDDLRPSELLAYEQARSGACTQVHHAAEAMLLDALVDALVHFAAEHPDAPRR